MRRKAKRRPRKRKRLVAGREPPVGAGGLAPEEVEDEATQEDTPKGDGDFAQGELGEEEAEEEAEEVVEEEVILEENKAMGDEEMPEGELDEGKALDEFGEHGEEEAAGEVHNEENLDDAIPKLQMKRKKKVWRGGCKRKSRKVKQAIAEDERLQRHTHTHSHTHTHTLTHTHTHTHRSSGEMCTATGTLRTP